MSVEGNMITSRSSQVCLVNRDVHDRVPGSVFNKYQAPAPRRENEARPGPQVTPKTREPQDSDEEDKLPLWRKSNTDITARPCCRSQGPAAANAKKGALFGATLRRCRGTQPGYRVQGCSHRVQRCRPGVPLTRMCALAIGLNRGCVAMRTDD